MTHGATAMTPEQLNSGLSELSDLPATVKNTAKIFKESKTESALRNDIHKSEDRFNSRGEKIAGNGLAKFNAIVRCGRKVLIIPKRYGAWLISGGK